MLVRISNQMLLLEQSFRNWGDVLTSVFLSRGFVVHPRLYSLGMDLFKKPKMIVCSKSVYFFLYEKDSEFTSPEAGCKL